MTTLECVNCNTLMIQTSDGDLPSWHCPACAYDAIEYEIGSGAYGWHAPANVLSAAPYLRFHLKLMNSAGEVVRSLSTGKQRRLHTAMNRHEWASATLRVSYSKDDASLCNDAICENAEELRQAITAFTEPELLDYIRGGKWGKS